MIEGCRSINYVSFNSDQLMQKKPTIQQQKAKEKRKFPEEVQKKCNNINSIHDR